ncbi:MAG: glycosyltransferase family 1 protein [Actinomycetota bacterium]
MRPRVAAVVESCWHRVPGGTATSTMRSLHAVRARGRHDVVGLAARHAEPPVLDEVGDLPVEHLPLPRPLLYEAWHRLRRPRFTRRIGPVDLIHATGGVIPPGSAPIVATIHDLAFVHTPEHFTPRLVRFMTRGFEIARDEAALIAVPSEATAADCETHGVERERLRIVPWGATRTEVDDAARRRARELLDLPDRFALFLGTLEPRKNVARLLDAHAAAAPDLPLLIAGPDGWGVDGARLFDETAHGDARHIGHIAPDLLPAVLDLAAVLAYPSLMEGFGMPVLEAMAQGTAAITSASTATAEVAGDTGVLVDPLDTVAIGEALASVRDDPAVWEAHGRAGAERAARFTWDATGAALSAVYDEAVA